MDSSTPLDSQPAPVALPVLAAVEAVLRELADQECGNFQKTTLAGGGASFAGQAKLPSFTGGGDTYPLFPGENRVSVAVATPGTMIKCGMTKSVEILLQSGPVWPLRPAKSPVPATWQQPVATGSPYSPRKNPSPSPPQASVVKALCESIAVLPASADRLFSRCPPMAEGESSQFRVSSCVGRVAAVPAGTRGRRMARS